MIVLKNCASVLTPCVAKLFRLCLSPSTFPSCWRYTYIQPVHKKDHCSNPSNYRPIAILSCLSKAFETILNRKILKHYPFLTSLIVSMGSTSDILPVTFLPSWSLSRFGETFAVALDMSKAFDRSLLSKLPSFGFYLTLCTFISSFLSGRSISDIVDGHCSTPKPINSGVPQGSLLSPTLVLLFINDLSITNCPLHSYAGGSTLH